MPGIRQTMTAADVFERAGREACVVAMGAFDRVDGIRPTDGARLRRRPHYRAQRSERRSTAVK